jgi:glycosyltransferase involved in cell wall biosynthesis
MGNPIGNISVAVTTHRRPKYVKECLLSICNQTYLPSEIIISQDGDDSETEQVINEIISKYEQIKFIYIVNKIPLGQLANRQQAFRLTTGEYIAMLDDDDQWGQFFLEKTYSVLSQQLDCVFCSSNHYFMDNDGGVLVEESSKFAEYCGRSTMKSGKYKDVFLRMIINNACIFSLQFTLFRRSVIDKIGFFQPFGRLVPDYSLMLVLGAQRTIGYFIDDYLGNCRVHAGQQTTKRLENSISKVECLSEINNKYKNVLTKVELNSLCQMFQKSLIECSIAYAHQRRRMDAIRSMFQFYQMGFGLPPIKRTLVLAALLIGIRKV